MVFVSLHSNKILVIYNQLQKKMYTLRVHTQYLAWVKSTIGHGDLRGNLD